MIAPTKMLIGIAIERAIAIAKVWLGAGDTWISCSSPIGIGGMLASENSPETLSPPEFAGSESFAATIRGSATSLGGGGGVQTCRPIGLVMTS